MKEDEVSGQCHHPYSEFRCASAMRWLCSSTSRTVIPSLRRNSLRLVPELIELEIFINRADRCSGIVYTFGLGTNFCMSTRRPAVHNRYASHKKQRWKNPRRGAQKVQNPFFEQSHLAQTAVRGLCL